MQELQKQTGSHILPRKINPQTHKNIQNPVSKKQLVQRYNRGNFQPGCLHMFAPCAFKKLNVSLMMSHLWEISPATSAVSKWIPKLCGFVVIFRIKITFLVCSPHFRLRSLWGCKVLYYSACCTWILGKSSSKPRHNEYIVCVAFGFELI